MNENRLNGDRTGRGRIWFAALAGTKCRQLCPIGSVLAADTDLGGHRVRYLAVVPDPQNRFPRARSGELGLEEGWYLAKRVREVIDEHLSGAPRPIVAIVDVRSQAYGRCEELLGIHLACAAAADAYADARFAGHPVIALVVGQ